MRNMTDAEAIAIYLDLTEDIHAYWGAFGVFGAVLVGWLISVKARLGVAQRMAVSLGYLAASGYIVSTLLNRYKMMKALMAEVDRLKEAGVSEAQPMLTAILDGASVYRNYEILVWTSYGLITFAFAYVIWSGITRRRDPG